MIGFFFCPLCCFLVQNYNIFPIYKKSFFFSNPLHPVETGRAPSKISNIRCCRDVGVPARKIVTCPIVHCKPSIVNSLSSFVRFLAPSSDCATVIWWLFGDYLVIIWWFSYPYATHRHPLCHLYRYSEILTVNYSLLTNLPLFGYYLVIIWLLFGDSATHTLPISTPRAIFTATLRY